MNYPIVSIMIATFNSEKVLPRTLEAIRAQTYPQDKLEILAIDGGSTDSTLEIAKKADCKIIDNPKTEPSYAKLLGFQECTGKYLISIDHDEVMENKNSILLKVKAAEDHPECKVVMCSGYKRPQDYPALNQYLSDFGDPFSLFMYNCPKDYQFWLPFLKKYFMVVSETDNFSIISFSKNTKPVLVEIACLGTMINVDYFKKIDIGFKISPILFYIMLRKGDDSIIVIKNDPLVHYSVDSLKAYLPKLKWRIKNNIHFPSKAERGFTGRQQYQKISQYKKYLFIPYSLTIIIPFVHSLVLSVQRKNPIYLMHPVLCLYVAFEILYQYSLKLFGKTPAFTSYDGKKKAVL
ncbi:glycosyltransferase family 2 protein [Treponema putidum]|uniref:Glycosyltransferase family 2 protein n=1 Tax=Treponema putidum TaxID=221027 RepID=A0ABY5HUQ7_9SPIR|nr:glycosyltransferase family 2 protein [Treponema putidum]UTY28304.1 glycosyltransferase family 2 protein [Treponema putidum]